MNKLKKTLHNKLGWGYPALMDEWDSFQPTYACLFCPHKLVQDSTGAWFHLDSLANPTPTPEDKS